MNILRIMSNPIRNIAIIPARGGSKRLPGKNIKTLGDLPLIAHSIKYAQQFPEYIHKIVVTTDDPEIAKIAQEYGASVVKRPAVLAGDHEPVLSALQHVLEAYSENYDAVVLLQPTNPLRPEGLLEEGMLRFRESKVDSLMSVSRFAEKYGTITGNSFVPENYAMGQRSQDLEPRFRENGLLYIIKCDSIKKGHILAKNNFALSVDHPYDRVDIDDAADFAFAQAMLNIEIP
jgi:CMP-N-acetylneuraminic acid synthetase